jgi:hypothetical protein
MANLSPSTVAINTIAHCLANALDVSAGLDTTESDDLRALLRIAVGEVDRVRKANRKATTAAKRANGGSSGKKTKSKHARAEEVEAQAKPAKPKSRGRKAEATVGLATH